MDDHQLANLIDINSSQAVQGEVQTILSTISPDYETTVVDAAFKLIVDLYEGRYPGYQACNTDYHDLHHITDTFLAMVRLIHGAICQGHTLSSRSINLGLIATLFHDSGYIQEVDDTEGTGGKYTLTHVKRSMDLLKKLGPNLPLSEADIAAGQSMILYTDLAVDFVTIETASAEDELMGKMLGVADLIAQVSDRVYLEKLPFLYREFKESQIGQYKDEIDLLRKTVGFFGFIDNRVEALLPETDNFLVEHFRLRWHINKNLYTTAIAHQKSYLVQILQIPNADLLQLLRRQNSPHRSGLNKDVVE